MKASTRRWRIRLFVGVSVVMAVLCIGPYLIPLPEQANQSPAVFASQEGRFITVADTRTFIREAGPSDGPAVVLVHGFGASTFSWRHTLPALAEAGYHVFALDLRGFGLSDKNFEADYTHAAQADFVAAVMTAVGIERATLVGHSMGGNVIAQFAMRHPDRVEALVFVDGAVNVGSDSLRGAVVEAVLRFPPAQRWGQVALRYFLTKERLSETQRTAYYDPTIVTTEVTDGYLFVQDLQDWDLALLGVVRDSGHNALPAPLSTITVPTLIVWGENDTWVPLERGQQLHTALPQSEWVVFAACGHLPMEEHPEQFNQTVIEFLGK